MYGAAPPDLQHEKVEEARFIQTLVKSGLNTYSDGTRKTVILHTRVSIGETSNKAHQLTKFKVHINNTP